MLLMPPLAAARGHTRGPLRRIGHCTPRPARPGAPVLWGGSLRAHTWLVALLLPGRCVAGLHVVGARLARD
jgi:hypothetical protein